MNLDSVNKWLTSATSIGVLAGIFFLVLELDQANRISRHSSENARRSQFIDANSSMIEHAQIYAKLQVNSENLMPADSVRALMMARQPMNTWLDAESDRIYSPARSD